MRTKKVPPPEKRCQMRSEEGRQCRAARVHGSEYCIFHHPWVRRHKTAAERIQGLPLRENSQIDELLAGAVRAVEEGKINPQQAYAIGWLVRLLRENLSAVEEERLEHEKEVEAYTKEGEPEFGEPESGEPASEQSPSEEKQESGATVEISPGRDAEPHAEETTSSE